MTAIFSSSESLYHQANFFPFDGPGLILFLALGDLRRYERLAISTFAKALRAVVVSPGSSGTLLEGPVHEPSKSSPSEVASTRREIELASARP